VETWTPPRFSTDLSAGNRFSPVGFDRLIGRRLTMTPQLAGRPWAWWNQNSDISFDLARLVQRALDARLGGILAKWGYPDVEAAFARAGLPWGTERYVYPHQAQLEGNRLADAVDAGAVLAVINAEKEWEALDAAPMELLIATFRARHPTTELYASVDTRGNRLTLPYQRVLAQHVAGWLPMIYPFAFYGRDGEGNRITPPPDFVARAFAACIDGHDFGGIPVYPTIQLYDDIGAAAVQQELAEVAARGLEGYQAYTIPHATAPEWAVIVNAAQEAPIAEPTVAQELAAIRALQPALTAVDLAKLVGQIRWLYLQAGRPFPS